MLRKSLRTALVLGALASASSLSRLGHGRSRSSRYFLQLLQRPDGLRRGHSRRSSTCRRGPTPPLVGHTYNTYPPLMPHEFLYHHHRTYYKYYHNGGYTSSHVRYHTGKVKPFIMRNTFGLF